jgi:hypothetical protein
MEKYKFKARHGGTPPIFQYSGRRGRKIMSSKPV